MGGNGSKAANQQQNGKKGDVVANLSATAAADAASKSEDPQNDIQKYTAFRDELLSFSLGESAFDYAEVLYKKNPESPEVMALLAETAAMYDANKNKVGRAHWVDRMDLLQRGVDVSRKCINDHRTYGPCYRTYVMCATREAEAEYWLNNLQGLGIVMNFEGIMKRGLTGMELMPKDAEVPNMLGALCGRCAHPWFSPFRYIAWYRGLPPAKELQKKSIEFHKKAVENNPDCLEYSCRLAQAYYMAGDYANARRWFSKVRDEMPPQDLKDSRWQGIAHTQLSTTFAKTKWNVPFA